MLAYADKVRPLGAPELAAELNRLGDLVETPAVQMQMAIVLAQTRVAGRPGARRQPAAARELQSLGRSPAAAAAGAHCWRRATPSSAGRGRPRQAGAAAARQPAPHRPAQRPHRSAARHRAQLRAAQPAPAAPRPHPGGTLPPGRRSIAERPRPMSARRTPAGGRRRCRHAAAAVDAADAAGYRVTAVDLGRSRAGQLVIERPHWCSATCGCPGATAWRCSTTSATQPPALPVILLTAHGTIPDAVEATQRGVFGYLTKPFDARSCCEQIAQALRLAARRRGRHEARDEAGAPRSSRAARDGRGAGPGAPGRRLRRECDASRRERHRQGAAGARHPPGQPARATSRSWPSTAARSPRSCSSPSCSATARARSPARSPAHKGLVPGGRRRHAASSTRSATCRSALQVKLLRVLQEREVRPVGATSRSRSTCASSRRPTATSKPRWRRAVPRGPVLPPERRHADAADAGRAARGHPAAGQRTSCSGWREVRQRRSTASRPRR